MMPDSDPIEIAARAEVERILRETNDMMKPYAVEREAKRIAKDLRNAARILEASGIRLVRRAEAEAILPRDWQILWDAAPVFGTPPAETKKPASG